MAEMTPLEDAKYREKLAREHMEDAIFEYDHSRWSKAALSAQLSMENSAKAVIGLFGPVAKTHDLAGTILELRSMKLKDEQKRRLERLAELTEKFGVKEHVLASYGDEVALKTPREIYDQSKAKRALNMAQEAFEIASRMIETIRKRKKKGF
ncbi:MAG: HEPN domain-containing protein [Deltaproteobacteria bacterium]|nr:HEPN domain-containing protein [Deltaproteobacteria bacterium]